MAWLSQVSVLCCYYLIIISENKDIEMTEELQH